MVNEKMKLFAQVLSVGSQYRIGKCYAISVRRDNPSWGCCRVYPSGREIQLYGVWMAFLMDACRVCDGVSTPVFDGTQVVLECTFFRD